MAEPKDPEVFFDMTEPKLKEVNNIIRKARAKSPPGPNQVPYLVNKNGPLLANLETPEDCMEEGLSSKILVKCRGLFNSQRGEFKHPRCIKHTSAVSHIIQEVKEQKGDLVVL